MSGTSNMSQLSTNWLTIDDATWRSNYGHRPFTISHDLATHPLLTFESICDLVGRLPEDLVEHNLGDIPEVFVDGEKVPRLDLSSTEIVRGIEHNGCWMVLKYVMHDPAYAEICNQVLDQVGNALGPGHDVSCPEAYIFVSGAASVTPTHCDPEHNFLLQARGEKAFTVGEPPDSESGQQHLEYYYRHGRRNTPFAPAQAATFDLKPGVGVYVPPHRPHFVKSRSELTLSLSVTWRPRDLRREGRVYAFNGRRRDHGGHPRPFGSSPILDSTKSTCERLLAIPRRVLRRPRAAGYS